MACTAYSLTDLVKDQVDATAARRKIIEANAAPVPCRPDNYSITTDKVLVVWGHSCMPDGRKCKLSGYGFAGNEDIIKLTEGREVLTYTTFGENMMTTLNASVVAALQCGKIPELLTVDGAYPLNCATTHVPNFVLDWADDPCVVDGVTVNKGVYEYDAQGLVKKENNYGTISLKSILGRYRHKKVLLLCCMKCKEEKTQETQVKQACVGQQSGKVVGAGVKFLAHNTTTTVALTNVGFGASILAKIKHFLHCASTAPPVTYKLFGLDIAGTTAKRIPLAGAAIGCGLAATRSIGSAAGYAKGHCDRNMFMTQCGLAACEAASSVATCWPGPGTAIALSVEAAVFVADAKIAMTNSTVIDAGGFETKPAWTNFCGIWEQHSGWGTWSKLERRFRVTPGQVQITYSAFRDCKSMKIVNERIEGVKLCFEIHWADGGQPCIATWCMDSAGAVVCTPSGNKYQLRKKPG